MQNPMTLLVTFVDLYFYCYWLLLLIDLTFPTPPCITPYYLVPSPIYLPGLLIDWPGPLLIALLFIYSQLFSLFHWATVRWFCYWFIDTQLIPLTHLLFGCVYLLLPIVMAGFPSLPPHWYIWLDRQTGDPLICWLTFALQFTPPLPLCCHSHIGLGCYYPDIPHPITFPGRPFPTVTLFTCPGLIGYGDGCQLDCYLLFKFTGWFAPLHSPALLLPRTDSSPPVAGHPFLFPWRLPPSPYSGTLI